MNKSKPIKRVPVKQIPLNDKVDWKYIPNGYVDAVLLIQLQKNQGVQQWQTKQN